MNNKVQQFRRSHIPYKTQQELADAVGVSRQTIANLEQKGGDLSGRTMLAIAKFFNVDPREIFFVDDVFSEHK